jgi:hypothetical protein
MALLAALIILIAKAMTIKHEDHNAKEDLTEQTDSRMSLLRHVA